jgi:hypothetical protein
MSHTVTHKRSNTHSNSPHKDMNGLRLPANKQLSFFLRPVLCPSSDIHDLIQAAVSTLRMIPAVIEMSVTFLIHKPITQKGAPTMHSKYTH